MIGGLTPEAAQERERIVAEIHAAFGHVTRGENAISWSECLALDGYESDEVCRAARLSDKDTQWSELVADPDWDPFPGVGGFCFINLQGFRYYLPPAMIRLLHDTAFEQFGGHLLRHINHWVRDPADTHWTAEQIRCIARFISFMARHDRDEYPHPDDPNPWADAFERRWRAYLPDDSVNADGHPEAPSR